MQADLDNHANQCNPNNDEYYDSRGTSRDDDGDDDDNSYQADDTQDHTEDYSTDNSHEVSQTDLDNHSNQLNPNNDAYHESKK